MFDKFLIGCCYYPEHWEEDSMVDDIARIKGLGFNCIRMGEFSWSMYEREEGVFDFSFLKRAVKLAEEAGLFVILGTPTAAPPRWLTVKHPEVLARKYDRTLMEHGSRQHHNHTSEVYLRYCARITEEMVKAFAGYKCVIGWQIDNELNCHRNESYNDADDAAFRVWLENKYGTVDALNRAWGNCFWSLDFSEFSEVTCPRPHPAYNNPSWMADYYLFLSDSVIHFAALQARIIREYAPGAFITHNGGFANVDGRRFTDECLDFMSFDSYPSFQERSGRGAGRKHTYRLSQMRGYSDKLLILEQQAGPGGQLRYLLPTPLPGQIRLWTYQSIANGALGVLYFRYRTALFGAEQLWYGIYDHSTEENYRSREVRKVAEELSRVGDIFLSNRPKNEVAIFSNYHNVTVDKIECFTPNDEWNVFTALNKRGIFADFVDETSDFGKYKAIIFPHITIIDELLEKKISEYASAGGTVIISARSGTKDKNSHFYPSTPPSILRKAVGCRVDWFTALASGESQFAEIEGKRYRAETYCEMLEPEGAQVVARYTEGFLAGKPAITRLGSVYYIGFYTVADAELYADILSEHIDVTDPIDEDTERFALGDYYLYLNHSERNIPLSGYDEISEKEINELPAYGVALIKKNNI